MSYIMARVLSAFLFVVAFIPLLLGQGALITNIIAVVLMICGLVIYFKFYRCPHCRQMLPRRGSPGEFCRHCGEKLDS